MRHYTSDGKTVTFIIVNYKVPVTRDPGPSRPSARMLRSLGQECEFPAFIRIRHRRHPGEAAGHLAGGSLVMIWPTNTRYPRSECMCILSARPKSISSGSVPNEAVLRQITRCDLPGGRSSLPGAVGSSTPPTMQDQKGIVCLKLQDGVVKAGTGWMKIWSYERMSWGDRKLNGVRSGLGRGSIWVPTCDDPDYVPIGIFYNQGYSEAALSALRVMVPELSDPSNEMNPNMLNKVNPWADHEMPAAAMVHHSFTKPMAPGDMYEAWRLAENVHETGALTLCEQRIGNARSSSAACAWLEA